MGDDVASPPDPANRPKYLAREWLPLKRIANLARGAAIDDWPLPNEWGAAMVHIETAIDQGRVEYARHPNGLIRFTRIRVEGLWEAIQGHQCQAKGAKDVQAALVAFCREWAEAQNVDLSRDPRSISTAGRRRRISESALRKFFDEHVNEHKDDDVPPSREDDLEAAYRRFGLRSEVLVDRAMIRKLRTEKAPHWTAGGRPAKK